MPPAPGVLLLSCYELGHQPLGLAWPLAALRQAGFYAAGLDLAVQPLEPALVASAGLVAIAVPMHTALRLGVQAAARVRAANPRAAICFFGLYAWLNRSYLLSDGPADFILGGEAEAPLVQLVQAVQSGRPPESVPGVATRLADSQPLPPGRVSARGPALPLPHRAGLPALSQYARYLNGGSPALTGYVEATRGCLHLCRHCPIVPIYHGRLVVVPVETVLADVRQQVQAGAAHLTFGDADFLNGPSHALRLARAVHAEFPQLTFDFTAKVEHILQHRRLFPEFAALGCTFVTTAVESLSDRVLLQLDKGHTAADVPAALDVLEAAGIAMQPTLVAFTPWTTLDDYLALVDFVAGRGLQDNLAPVQLSIRLLLPPGSLLLDSPDRAEWLGPLDAANFSYAWRHPDPRLDALATAVSACVMEDQAQERPAAETHARLRALAYAAAGRPVPPVAPAPARPPRTVPRLSEDWFCCAEPTQGQVALLQDTGLVPDPKRSRAAGP